MKEISTEIGISAPPEKVWEVLTDFPAFPQWNAFVQTVEGQLTAGAELIVRIQPPGGMAMTFKPNILKVDPNRELRWLGRLWFPGVFDGEHYFLVEELGPGQTRFTQGERFAGILVPLMGMIGLYPKTLLGFSEMNQALKDRVEGLG